MTGNINFARIKPQFSLVDFGGLDDSKLQELKKQVGDNKTITIQDTDGTVREI